MKIEIGKLNKQDKKNRKAYPIKISREVQITDYKNASYNGNIIVAACEIPPNELFKVTKEVEMSDFISLAKYNGLSLMMWDSENYASENTKLASDFYKAGAQSQQQKIDEFQKRIDDALNVMCKLQYSSGERIYDEVGKILKGQPK